MKSKVDKLDVNELVPGSFGLSKLSYVVKSDVVKKYVYNAKTKYIEDKIPNIANLAGSTTLNAKIKDVKEELPSITNLHKTAAFNANMNEVENEIRNITNWATTIVLTAVENKITNHSK